MLELCAQERAERHRRGQKRERQKGRRMEAMRLIPLQLFLSICLPARSPSLPRLTSWVMQVLNTGSTGRGRLVSLGHHLSCLVRPGQYRTGLCCALALLPITGYPTFDINWSGQVPTRNGGPIAHLISVI